MKYIIFVRIWRRDKFYWCVDFADLGSVWVINKKEATVFNDKEKARLELQSIINSQRNLFYDRANRKVKVIPVIQEVK